MGPGLAQGLGDLSELALGRVVRGEGSGDDENDYTGPLCEAAWVPVTLARLLKGTCYGKTVGPKSDQHASQLVYPELAPT